MLWFPTNYLLIEALERYHYFYGDSLKIQGPEGDSLTLQEGAAILCDRLIALFLPDEAGHRPCLGGAERYRDDPHWKDLHLFYEYFHAETGKGLGASHQTGWTSLVVRLIRERAEKLRRHY